MFYFDLEAPTNLAQFLFFFFGNDSLLFNVNPDVGIQAHVKISNPNECKASNKVTNPIIKQELILGYQQEKNCYIVAETVFTGEDIKKFSFRNRFT